jgi:hypothetical protein
MKHLSETSNPRQSYWWRYHIGECPPCGRDQSYRERMTTPRPERREDRYVCMSSSEAYCGCIDRDM